MRVAHIHTSREPKANSIPADNTQLDPLFPSNCLNMPSPRDVQMQDDSQDEGLVKAATEASLANEIELSFTSLQRSAAEFDNRHVFKVFRDLGSLRRKIKSDPAALASVISKHFADNHPRKKLLLAQLETLTPEVANASSLGDLPEISAYVHLLVQIYLLDTEKLDQLAQFNESVVSLIASYNRRTLDFILAKIWFYVSRTCELRGDMLSIRPTLLNALRNATLRHDDETTASIITLLLRNYILTHDINQANNLCEKIVFPANAGNALSARYYYYLSRINAIQLDYSTAHEYLTVAIRKAPQTHLSKGFLQDATKLIIVIELLMGDIPSLKVFKSSTGNVEPYFLVTKAVRSGDLKLFGAVVKKYEEVFVRDNNFTLISRLRQNVIKTGIRKISLSYSKISLKDICIKLNLDSEEATEYIVSKAIRDGVIEATVDHEQGFMKSKELLDVYSTKLPQEDFDQRIRFCLSLHTDSVKAMRYPIEDNKNENRKALDGLEDEVDLLQAIDDGDLDDFMD